MEKKEVTLTLQKTEPDAPTTRDAAIRRRVMQIEDEETRNYLLDRVLPQMTWYSQKAANYRATYYRLMTVSVVMCAAIPAFAACADSNAVKTGIAFLGSAVMAVNAYNTLRNFRGLSAKYRKARETLSHILYCYFNKAEAFKGMETPENLNVLLVDACEAAIKKG